MRIPRVFTDRDLVLNEPFQLDERASHHLCTVLRMDAGRALIAFDGSGYEYEAVIETPHKKHAIIRASRQLKPERESPLSIHLAVGVSRGERFDFVLQKATELGASRITPLFTERTEVRIKGERLAKKQQQWQQLLISACEQCQRNVLPTLDTAIELQEFLETPNAGLKLVLHHRSQVAIAQYPKPSRVTFLIGPEGGLSDDEIARAHRSDYAALTLGPRVLRTETAPLAALSVAQLLWGDF